jgi:hypothetical protein
MFRWTEEHSRQMYTPYVTLDHVGLRALQSKQTYTSTCQLKSTPAPKAMSAQGQCTDGRDTRSTRLVGLLALEDLEDGLRLRLSGLGHWVRE